MWKNETINIINELTKKNALKQWYNEIIRSACRYDCLFFSLFLCLLDFHSVNTAGFQTDEILTVRGTADFLCFGMTTYKKGYW